MIIIVLDDSAPSVILSLFEYVKLEAASHNHQKLHYRSSCVSCRLPVDFLDSCRANTLLAELDDEEDLPEPDDDDDENEDDNQEDQEYEEVLVIYLLFLWHE